MMKVLNAGVLAAALCGMQGLAVPAIAGTGERSEPPSVTVLGAVRQPGEFSVSASSSGIDQIVEAAGGAMPQGYRLATIVLRPAVTAAAAHQEADCVPPDVWQTFLMLRDDPVLDAQADIVERLMAGRLRRIDAYDIPRGSLGSDPGPAALRGGDMLLLPERTQVVYVATSAKRTVSVPHEPLAQADEYLKRAELGDKVKARDFVLYYPNGRWTKLALGHWEYKPTAVPPGSLLAPASVACLSGG